MKTLNTSSGEYAAIFHAPFDNDERSDRLRHLSV